MYILYQIIINSDNNNDAAQCHTIDWEIRVVILVAMSLTIAMQTDIMLRS